LKPEKGVCASTTHKYVAYEELCEKWWWWPLPLLSQLSFRISEMPKLKAGSFVGPQITKVILDENFAQKLNSAD
jgi:hypothetical protein